MVKKLEASIVQFQKQLDRLVYIAQSPQLQFDCNLQGEKINFYSRITEVFRRSRDFLFCRYHYTKLEKIGRKLHAFCIDNIYHMNSTTYKKIREEILIPTIKKQGYHAELDPKSFIKDIELYRLSGKNSLCEKEIKIIRANTRRIKRDLEAGEKEFHQLIIKQDEERRKLNQINENNRKSEEELAKLQAENDRRQERIFRRLGHPIIGALGMKSKTFD